MVLLNSSRSPASRNGAQHRVLPGSARLRRDTDPPVADVPAAEGATAGAAVIDETPEPADAARREEIISPAGETRRLETNPLPPAAEPQNLPAAIVERETLSVAVPVAVASVRRIRVKRWVLAAAIGVAAVVAAPYGVRWWQWSGTHISTDNAFIDAHIVQVSPRVTGHVAKVYVDDNQVVKAGDLLLELDPADAQAAVSQAEATLTGAKADLTAARSAVEEARAHIASAQAETAQTQAQAASKAAQLKQAMADYAQYAKARENGAITGLEWDKIDTARQTAQAASDAAQKVVASNEAQVIQAEAAVKSREGQVAVAEAQIQAAQAALDKANLSLSYTRITAPTDGRVTRKSVEPGNFVIPAQPLMALVAPDLWVTANFKETQLTEMKPGQKVALEVDAYPGMKLAGHIDSIQQGAGARFSLLPPENATGNYVKVVQRVPVKILLDEQPADGRILGPGMSVVPTVELK